MADDLDNTDNLQHHGSGSGGPDVGGVLDTSADFQPFSEAGSPAVAELLESPATTDSQELATSGRARALALQAAWMAWLSHIVDEQRVAQSVASRLACGYSLRASTYFRHWWQEARRVTLARRAVAALDAARARRAVGRAEAGGVAGATTTTHTRLRPPRALGAQCTADIHAALCVCGAYRWPCRLCRTGCDCPRAPRRSSATSSSQPPAPRATSPHDSHPPCHAKACDE